MLIVHQPPPVESPSRCRQKPDYANPILFGAGSSVSGRIRLDQSASPFRADIALSTRRANSSHLRAVEKQPKSLKPFAVTSADHGCDLKHRLPAIERGSISSHSGHKAGVFDKGTATNLHDDILVD